MAVSQPAPARVDQAENGKKGKQRCNDEEDVPPAPMPRRRRSQKWLHSGIAAQSPPAEFGTTLDAAEMQRRGWSCGKICHGSMSKRAVRPQVR